MKIDVSVPEEKSSFKMLQLTFFSKLVGALSLFQKLPPRKFELKFVL